MPEEEGNFTLEGDSAGYPYARALQQSKWQSRNLCDAEVSYKEGKIGMSVKIQLYELL